jgi:arginyl-tRNA synthetase
MKKALVNILNGVFGAEAPAELFIPEDGKFGHYSTNIAMRLAKARGKAPLALAGELAAEIMEKAPAGFFEKVEAVAPGFINFWIGKTTLRGELKEVFGDGRFGLGEGMKGKTVMVEFTDPNPFKLFHIGHLMSNTIGESFARLYEAAGAKVIRTNYQGDVGLHVAKAIWGMTHGGAPMPEDDGNLSEKMEFLGKAYASGSAAYEVKPEAKDEIGAINEKIYSRSDAGINKLYDRGREWSLAYFETVYERLGTKFDRYFFEGEMAREGMELVRARKDIFIESDGAIIFPGERYGLHTRVFVSSKGLPTYEAKELGLNKKKFELYPLDLSVIVTGNEIADYFKVLLKVMELMMPNIADKTRHVAHGMLRLPGGKVSSRTGDVITAESLLDQMKTKIREHVSNKSDLDEKERETVTESIAIGAIKYSILKQNPGQDIVFDFDKSLSAEGDSGPYIQYAYARLRSIVRKSSLDLTDVRNVKFDLELLGNETELVLIRKIAEFPDIVARAGELNAPSSLVSYLYKLAAIGNRFYETTPILKDENEARRNARLMLVSAAANVLKSGLGLLGMKTLEKI